LPYISEALVVQRQDKLVGLVYPEWERAEKEGLPEEELLYIMKKNMETLNQQMPNYCRLNEIQLQKEPFEKTPKQSIRRFLYQ
jgi:long-chain acyl-CoA synthetase